MNNEDLFETPPAPLSNTPAEPVVVPEKPKKAKKQMTPEKKEELINRLTTARQKLAENREAKKALKEQEKNQKKEKPQPPTPAAVAPVPVAPTEDSTPTVTNAPKKVRKPTEKKPDIHGEKLDKIHGAISELLEYKKNKHSKKTVEPTPTPAAPTPAPTPTPTIAPTPAPAPTPTITPVLPSFRTISSNRLFR